ncbi:MAG: twin-arginine translocase TatA/TatE family subunit [Flavobacteriales bacterium]|nr:twin-arginine translocase TatA/TatE family subunit [Flavobacteriales bacterium]
MLLFLDISGSEMLVVVLVALLLFGGDKLPEVIRSIARGKAYIQNASQEVKNQINRESGLGDAINDVRRTVEEASREASQDFDPTWETVVPTPEKPKEKETAPTPDADKEN